MEKPAAEPAGPDLGELIWQDMETCENPSLRRATPAWLEAIYQVGAIDKKRFRLPQWQAAFAKCPKDETGYLVSPPEFKKLRIFFHQAKIKKPFDLSRMKDGARPVTWLEELYLKVLRFETSLSYEQWKQLVETEIKPRFAKGPKLALGAGFRQWLQAILDKHVSPLRQLELWYREKSLAALAPKPTAKPDEPKKTPTKWENTKSSFDAEPNVTQKSSAIQQLFYHAEQHPVMDDQESLDFLDQLAELEDDEGDKL